MGERSATTSFFVSPGGLFHTVSILRKTQIQQAFVILVFSSRRLPKKHRILAFPLTLPSLFSAGHFAG